MTLHLQFRTWITLCVTLPIAVLLILVNLNLWSGLQAAHHEVLQEAHQEIYSELEGILSAERVRIRSLASVPITEALLASVERKKGGSSLARRQEANAKIQVTWPSLTRSDVQVRNVLDNTVGNLFGHLSKSRERSSQLLLTDGVGALIASSYRPEKYDFSGQEWWKKAREASSDRILGEGITPEGGVDLTLAIWGDYQTRVLEGVLHESMSLKDYNLQNLSENDDVGLCSFITAKNAWFVRGSTNVAEVAHPYLGEMATRSSGGISWGHGFRFTSRQVDANLQWHEPLYVLTLRKEPYLPISILGPQILSVLASLAVLGALIFFSNRAGKQMIFDPLHKLVEAGIWAMQQAPHSRFDPATLPLEFQPDASSPVRKNLDEWITGMKQEVDKAIYTQTYETQKDMELARDFQQAYLNRPYPKIPAHHTEGRLRLSFGHRYESATALGGDFFNIASLPDECAGIFIGEVMGHGTRTALITAILRTLISDLAAQGRNVSHFMAEMNKQFCEILQMAPNPQFASSFYFVADTLGRVATYSTAGHRPPYLLRRSIGRVVQLTLPEPHGAALGVTPDEEYTGGHARLMDGDFYLFYTAGICETRNASDQEFGAARLESLLKRLVYKSMDEILDGLLSEVREFAGEEAITKDLCLVAVEVTTKPDLGV